MRRTMTFTTVIRYVAIAVFLSSCGERTDNSPPNTDGDSQEEKMTQTMNSNLPTVGVLIFDGVILNEVVAPLDVFSHSNEDGKPLFNVVTLAKQQATVKTAQGLRIVPDAILDESPELDVLVVPSSYTPEKQTSDDALVDFVKMTSKKSKYVASHCAGAFLIGETGIARGKNIVTYQTGGELLKQKYPGLKVMDDSRIGIVEDGNVISSNGNLVSYLASLRLLEKMTSPSHRKHVAQALMLDRLVAGVETPESVIVSTGD
jgi:transcriptional regulator GlxA family with amidase domain